MSDRKRKRSRSHSRSRKSHRSSHVNRVDRLDDKKLDQMQQQITNLTNIVEMLVESQKEKIPVQQETTSQSKADDIKENDKNMENNQVTETPEEEDQTCKIIGETPPQDSSRDVILKALGADLNDSKFKEVNYHPELKNTWGKWVKHGLPEKNKTEILELYNRKKEFYVEAPKLNLEILPMLTDIAKKRDQHFVNTQNCVGTSLAALGAAVSMIIDPSEGEVDQDILMDYLSHAGQMMADVFYQQSIARKSFITPQMDKSIKPTVEESISDEWLYGDNLVDKVKNAKEIEKACAQIKDKSKKDTYVKARDSGNVRYPPAANRQAGYSQKRRVVPFRRRPFYKPFQGQTQASTSTSSRPTSQTPSKTAPQMTNQSLSKR